MDGTGEPRRERPPPDCTGAAVHGAEAPGGSGAAVLVALSRPRGGGDGCRGCSHPGSPCEVRGGERSSTGDDGGSVGVGVLVACLLFLSPYLSAQMLLL